MSILTIPRNDVPIGVVLINGQQVTVAQHPEFTRFFFDLFQRVGGTTSSGTDDLLIGGLAPPSSFDSSGIDASLLGLMQMPVQSDAPQQTQDVDGRIASLEAQVSVLIGVIQDMRQGSFT